MSWSTSFGGIDESGKIGGVAVVVDVMRAFTTAAWAFERGIERIILAAALEEALTLKARFPGVLALKDGEPAPGFDLSNSPAQIRERTDLAGKVVVQRTTAGTVGAVAARAAARLYCVSFVCARATAEHIRRSGPSHVAFVVTGDDGRAEEDRACADYIAGLLENPALAAAPFLRRAAASKAAARLKERVDSGEKGVDARDVGFCLDADRLPFAMIAQDVDGLLTLRAAGPNAGSPSTGIGTL